MAGGVEIEGGLTACDEVKIARSLCANCQSMAAFLDPPGAFPIRRAMESYSDHYISGDLIMKLSLGLVKVRKRTC